MAFRFDVAFSFAGPHRDKVRAIADLVAAKLGRERVFFDEWYEAEILGDEMDVLLQSFYHEQSLMVVADLSDEYAGRPWCQAEARAIRALRFDLDPARDQTGRLRLLNARFDDGNVPGIFKTSAYLDVITKTVEQSAELILQRLDLLRQRLGSAASISNSVPAALAPAAAQQPPILFFHPATNDALYSRRERELDWLDACAKDARIRIATVTGVGGLGKTSLVGHWIEVRKGWRHRVFRGVYFYSFYSDRESGHFFAAFLEFVCEIEKIAALPTDKPLHHLAAAAARKWCYLIVLDGLEVLQRDESDPHYGWINDGELNEFVARAGAAGPSLVVLTSRFPFPQLTREHPDAARGCELPLFTNEEGADLLARCGLGGEREKLKGYSHQFGGHPLALRLFAGACLAQPFDEPETVSQHLLAATAEASDEDKHRRQFRKLLLWLQDKLPAPKRRLLQIVALFRQRVATATLIALATGLNAMKADFAGCDATRIHSLLDALVREHLLQREDAPGSDIARWSAHPIVRDIFRDEALKAGDTVTKQFARIVGATHKGSRLQSVAELKPIFEAIEVLLDAGDFKAADLLYRVRTENGDVFKLIPAPQEGLRCARGFVEPKERRVALEKAIGREGLGYYLNEVGLWGNTLGEIEEVERGYKESLIIAYTEKSWKNVSVILQNLAEAQTLRGALWEATATASEALFYAGGAEAETPWNAAPWCRIAEGATRHAGRREQADASAPQQAAAPKAETNPRFPERPSSTPPHVAESECNSHAYRAQALSLAGKLSDASREFAAADANERSRNPNRYPLYSLRGIWRCRYRLRLGEMAAARMLVEANRAFSEGKGWNNDRALCDLLLGELNVQTEGSDSAEGRIGEVVRIFREARYEENLSDALLVQARLRRSVEDCEEALRMAQRSGFALKECDALNLRAVLRRELAQPEELKDASAKAHDDARQALAIAERCEYYWGRHEALRQRRDAAKALGNRADEKHWDEAEKALAAKMKPEIEEALRINREHDAEMERLYGRR